MKTVTPKVLQEVTSQESHRNQTLSSANTSGVCGVTFDKSSGRWLAQIGVSGTNINLGYFTDFAAASTALEAADIKYGFSTGHGIPAIVTDGG